MGGWTESGKYNQLEFLRSRNNANHFQLNLLPFIVEVLTNTFLDTLDGVLVSSLFIRGMQGFKKMSERNCQSFITSLRRMHRDILLRPKEATSHFESVVCSWLPAQCSRVACHVTHHGATELPLKELHLHSAAVPLLGRHKTVLLCCLIRLSWYLV